MLYYIMAEFLVLVSNNRYVFPVGIVSIRYIILETLIVIKEY